MSMGRIMDMADHYAIKEGVDFNKAPELDFAAAPLGKNLANEVGAQMTSDADFAKFTKALSKPDHPTVDSIISAWLKSGRITGRDGKSVYSEWKYSTECLEGFNVAHVRATRWAPKLYRFIGDIDELGNYLHGRWRKKGDSQDRVPTTVGGSNPSLDADAAAKIAYDTRSLRGWIQPVRYSPYPRMQESSQERFGSEKDATYAGEGEVHLHVGCPIPPADHVNILLQGVSKRRREEIVARYGKAGVIQ